MARQVGIVKIVGKIQGISYYHSLTDGYLARKPGGFDGDRIKNEAGYRQVRNNSKEFATASRAAKLIKDALPGLTNDVADRRFLSRLTGKLVKVVRMDTTHEKGSREVLPENLHALKGFEFNKQKPFSSVSGVPYQLSYTRSGEEVEIKVGGLKNQLVGNRTYRFAAGIATIDFSRGDAKATICYSEPCCLSFSEFPHFKFSLTKEEGHTGIIVVGLQYADSPDESTNWCTEVLCVADVF